jgi:hyperosmotically inducible protein
MQIENNRIFISRIRNLSGQLRKVREMNPMKQTETHRQFLVGSVAVLAGVLAIAGCHNQSGHLDEKAAVTSALSGSSLNNVSVSQDRDKGVMTLTGNVASNDLKSQAENLAKQAAPDYTIADEIGVRPTGDQSQAGSVASNLDSGIEDNFKASIKAHKNLDDQSIHAKAKNGTLVLTGSVKTTRQKKEAEKLAKEVPHVQQVVNELEVEPNKHSAANS